MNKKIHFLEDGYYVEKLEKENQQLKEKYNIRSEAYNKVLLENASLKDKEKLYKDVIGQIKISVSTSKYAYEEGYQIDDAVLDDILQILDKVKENK